MENQILERLGAIERNSLLAAKSVLTLEEASLYTGLSKAYLYRLRRYPTIDQTANFAILTKRSLMYGCIETG